MFLLVLKVEESSIVNWFSWNIYWRSFNWLACLRMSIILIRESNHGRVAMRSVNILVQTKGMLVVQGLGDL